MNSQDIFQSVYAALYIYQKRKTMKMSKLLNYNNEHYESKIYQKYIKTIYF